MVPVASTQSITTGMSSVLEAGNNLTVSESTEENFAEVSLQKTDFVISIMNIASLPSQMKLSSLCPCPYAE